MTLIKRLEIVVIFSQRRVCKEARSSKEKFRESYVTRTLAFKPLPNIQFNVYQTHE